MKAAAKKQTKKKRGMKPANPAVLKAAIMDALKAQDLSDKDIAAKFKVPLATVKNYEGQLKRAEKLAKVESDWPGDSAGQLRRFLSQVCKLGSCSRPADVKELATAAKTLGEIVLTFDGRASSITATESKNSNVNLELLTDAQLEFLANLEGGLSGQRVKDPPRVYDPANPVVYSDSEPDGIEKNPEAKP